MGRLNTSSVQVHAEQMLRADIYATWAIVTAPSDNVSGTGRATGSVYLSDEVHVHLCGVLLQLEQHL